MDEVETAARDRVVVFGSLPPEGRDLDVLVRDEDLVQVADALSERGFERRGLKFVRLRGCDAEAIELTPLSSWGLQVTEGVGLFDRARPVPGYRKICIPSGPHALLILARRLVRSGGGLDPKRRRLLEKALESDADAWVLAAAAAESWGATAALAGLRSAYEQGRPAARGALAQAIAEELRIRDLNAPRLRALRTLSKRPKSGAVISLSGLDGCGKTTQAEALRSTLERLGYEAVVEWTKIARNPSLGKLSRTAKRLLSRETPSSGSPEKSGSVTRASEVTASPGASRREKSDLLTHAWAAIVSLTNAWSHRRVTTAHTRHGRVVICDRYVLDTAAHLRYRYGDRHRFRLQTLLNRSLSPKPLCSFFLDVSAQEALRRKSEQYDLGQLTHLASLYRAEAERLGVAVLDGGKELEELCEEIAWTVWQRLTER